ncbi:MAG: HAD family phosphatase [Spirochaetes bacterium]|nr:HAD family phosphatase [Spirochaetota bacterium]
MFCVDGYGIEAAAFDMDGLMVDSELVVMKLWKMAGAAKGWDIGDEILLNLVGRSGALWRKGMSEALGPGFSYDEVRAERIRLETAYYHENPIPIKPGLIELLDFLGFRGIPLAVATSTPRVRVLPLLSKAGILDRFEFLICGDEVEHPKPAPEVYLRLAAKLGVETGYCLVLEDSPAGIEAAFWAGTIPVMVPDLVQPDEAALGRAARVFGDLGEVRRWLEGGASSGGSV